MPRLPLHQLLCNMHTIFSRLWWLPEAPVFSRRHWSNMNSLLLKRCFMSMRNMLWAGVYHTLLEQAAQRALCLQQALAALEAPVLGSLHEGNANALLLQGCFFNDMRGKRDAAGDVVQPALDYSDPIRRFCALRGIACPPGQASACQHQHPSDAHPLSVPPLSAPSTAPSDTDLVPEHPAAAGDAPGRQPFAATSAVPPAAGAELPAAGEPAGSRAHAAADAAGVQADGSAPAAGGALRSGSGTPAEEEYMRHGIPSAGKQARWQLPEVPGHRTAAMENTRISDLFLRVSTTKAGCCSLFQASMLS